MLQVEVFYASWSKQQITGTIEDCLHDPQRSKLYYLCWTAGYGSAAHLGSRWYHAALLANSVTSTSSDAPLMDRSRRHHLAVPGNSGDPGAHFADDLGRSGLSTW